jgi:hypothetical protein
MGWINEAWHQGGLQITEDKMCPFCNPTKDLNKPTKLKACKEHRWVNKRWFEAWYDSNGNIRRQSS